MLDDNGYLLKLLEEKSLKEKAFYDLVFIKEPENEEWLELKKYLPRYYGPVNVFNGIENCIPFKTIYILDIHIFYKFSEYLWGDEM